MLVKNRCESLELVTLSLLEPRMKLEQKDKHHYFNLTKGYDGEIVFDGFIKNITTGNLVLSDLLLENNNTTFQIDSLVITQGIIYQFEVKNYEGDYFYEGERLKRIKGEEISDPIIQLKRSETLLRQLLKSHGFNYSLESYIVFINPEFTFYQAPLNQPIIFHSQLNRFINNVNNKNSKLNSSHTQLAEKLKSLHLSESPFSRLPSFEYSQLKKGIICTSCHKIIKNQQSYYLICSKCGAKENAETAILRNIEDYRLLFPNNKISTNTIHDWCGDIFPKK